MAPRVCSRTTCNEPAVATLTFVYVDSTAVLGPLARQAEPHTYDLCRHHATTFSVPRGWDIITVPGTGEEPVDELGALAAAVSEAEAPAPAGRVRVGQRDTGERPRPRLELVRDPDEDA